MVRCAVMCGGMRCEHNGCAVMCGGMRCNQAWCDVACGIARVCATTIQHPPASTIHIR